MFLNNKTLDIFSILLPLLSVQPPKLLDQTEPEHLYPTTGYLSISRIHSALFFARTKSPLLLVCNTPHTCFYAQKTRPGAFGEVTNSQTGCYVVQC